MTTANESYSRAQSGPGHRPRQHWLIRRSVEYFDTPSRLPGRASRSCGRVGHSAGLLHLPSDRRPRQRLIGAKNLTFIGFSASQYRKTNCAQERWSGVRVRLRASMPRQSSRRARRRHREALRGWYPSHVNRCRSCGNDLTRRVWPFDRLHRTVDGSRVNSGARGCESPIRPA
jgi:hypothetical protein